MVDYRSIVINGKVSKVYRSYPHINGMRKGRSRSQYDFKEALDYVPACAIHFPRCGTHMRLTMRKKYISMAGKYLPKPYSHENYQVEEAYFLDDFFGA